MNVNILAAGANSWASSSPAVHLYQATDVAIQSAHGFTNKEEFEVRIEERIKKILANQTQKEAVRHIETTLARSLFNCDELYVSYTSDCVHLAHHFSELPTLARLSPFAIAWSSNGTRHSSGRRSQIKKGSTVCKELPVVKQEHSLTVYRFVSGISYGPRPR